MIVRCTASKLVVRALPDGEDTKERLKQGQTVAAYGQSFDGEWLYIGSPAGWVSKQFLEEVTEPAASLVKPKWIGAAKGNYRTGRPGNPKIDMILIHVIEGTLKSCDNWFNNSAVGVSAHYGIGRKRELHQYVEEENTAYHAGRVNNPTSALVKRRPGVNPNNYSIGIEHEGTADSIWPDTMYEDSARLVAVIAKRHDILLDRVHVVGHREIYSLKTCPGRGDVDRIVTMAREINL